ncbi:sugar phosphate nucleotidyltransferase [Pseudopontixanthobacter vadosimaris]|uniref:sugar phosphate nucleotidyltransferase n=1 Tax=Pseudopontixanthobacter vadosimaris TaxID=2726450 RepID=UPI001473D036
MIVPVILCGGIGTRLWPRSRAAKAKPFLPLVGETTLFEATLRRCRDRENFAAPVIVTGDAHLANVEAQLGTEDREAQIIIEPEGKNTAAAIALAAARLPGDAIMLICPSDHYIPDESAFLETARAAAALAEDRWLVAFGIEARTPETGFGYLRQGEPVGSGHRIASFVEKPDRETAERFLQSGEYSWNGGIFAFRADQYLDELQRFRPALHAAVMRSVAGGASDGRRFHPDAAAFAEIESESVDYAIMENTDRAAMVSAAFGWSDIGNWDAVHAARQQLPCSADRADAQGNLARGAAEIVDCRNIMIDSDGPRVSAIGLKDLVIIVDGDEILVTTKDGVQEVGKLSGVTER